MKMYGDLKSSSFIWDDEKVGARTPSAPSLQHSCQSFYCLLSRCPQDMQDPQMHFQSQRWSCPKQQWQISVSAYLVSRAMTWGSIRCPKIKVREGGTLWWGVRHTGYGGYVTRGTQREYGACHRTPTIVFGDALPGTRGTVGIRVRIPHHTPGPYPLYPYPTPPYHPVPHPPNPPYRTHHTHRTHRTHRTHHTVPLKRAEPPENLVFIALETW